jgi:hypothetical protein
MLKRLYNKGRRTYIAAQQAAAGITTSAIIVVMLILGRDIYRDHAVLQCPGTLDTKPGGGCCFGIV